MQKKPGSKGEQATKLDREDKHHLPGVDQQASQYRTADPQQQPEQGAPF